MAGAIYLEIDASELSEELKRLEDVMEPRQFQQAMYGIFRRTGGHVRKILGDDIPKQYHVKKSVVRAAVGASRTTSAPGIGVGCVIPVKDRRGTIGGRYTAFGGARGWESLRKKYRMSSRIVRSGKSTLPQKMPGVYGGHPPFRNTSSAKLGRLTWTRKTKERFPIMPVVGLSVAQMPLNRSEADVQEDIKTYLQSQIEHRIQALILNGR